MVLDDVDIPPGDVADGGEGRLEGDEAERTGEHLAAPGGGRTLEGADPEYWAARRAAHQKMAAMRRLTGRYPRSVTMPCTRGLVSQPGLSLQTR